MNGNITLEELSAGLKTYLQGLGITESRVNELIKSVTGDKTKLNTTDKSTLVNAINELSLGQKYKLTTDNGQGFGLSNGDANTCTGTNTTYFGENIVNSPNQAIGTWWTIENFVTADGQYGHQTATAWHTDERYIRNKRAGNWSAWRSL